MDKEGKCVKCGGPFVASIMGKPVIYAAVMTEKGLVHWSPITCLEFKKKSSESKGS